MATSKLSQTLIEQGTRIGLQILETLALDNVLTIVGNGKIFSDNIQNFRHNEFRRVDLFMQLNHDADVPQIIAALRKRLAQIPNVLSEPVPDVEILEFNLSGPKLAVRPHVNNAHYWQVYFDTNRVIQELGAERQLHAPAQHVVVHGNGQLPAAAIVADTIRSGLQLQAR